MQYDVVIIGAGIVGLAITYQLLQKEPGLKVAIIEKEVSEAQHQTGNNSGVIHSGIYYKPGSLKATNCIEGYQMLLDFCDEFKVPYDLCGKIIVATKESELPQLENIYARGVENGLEGLEILDQQQVNEKEPFVKSIKGVWVPQTGIIDYTMVAKVLRKKLEMKKVQFLTSEQVINVELRSSDVSVQTVRNKYNTRLVVNCAGLYADKIAHMTGAGRDVQIIPFRGEYYEMVEKKKHLVNNLIYPVPDPNFPFLGVHFTRMINGGVEAGPNAVLAFSREGYKKRDINLREFIEVIRWRGFRKVATQYWRTGLGEIWRSFSKRSFVKALKQLVPAIEMEDLMRAPAGVRAQACFIDGRLADDFVIREQKGIVHVINAPSPAATSCLSIGDHISEKVLEQLK